MNARTTKIDFAGQDLYVGIDVHLKSWTVSVRCNGLKLKTFSMDPVPEKLVAYLHKNYPGGIYHSVYEAGFSGFWIHRQLISLGVNNIVAHTGDIPTGNTEKSRKSDAVDSAKLARELDKGDLRGIYVPDEHKARLRSLCRFYRSRVKECTRIKARLKCQIYYDGVRIPRFNSQWPDYAIRELQSRDYDNGPLKEIFDLSLSELVHHKQQCKDILAALKKTVTKSDETDLFENICTIPGIGFKLGMILYTEIIDINRFKCLDHLKSYAGISPHVQSSGQTEYVMGLKRQCNRHVRYAIIEAAWNAIRHDTEMLSIYNKYRNRMRPQQAIIRIARKLLSRLMYVWRHNTAYEPMPT